MKVALLCLGKTNKLYVQNGLLEFEKRLRRYCDYERIELKDLSKSMKPDLLKQEEAKQILAKLKPNDSLVLLDEKGKSFTSRAFAKQILTLSESTSGRLVFAVAGAYGAGEELKNRAKLMLSLSEMTYSHQLIRLIFVEQLYRAFAIINNHPYHND